MNGCIEAVHRDGEVVGERHRYDNRLSMAVLTRLDRLAERTGDRDATLRTLSEDMEDFCDLVEAGGDTDAFVDARRPPSPPEPAPTLESETARMPTPAPKPARLRVEDDYDLMAKVMGRLDYKSEHPFDIDLTDLEDLDKSQWSADQLLRARYSGYLAWLDLGDDDADDPDAEEPDDSPSAFKAEFDAVLTLHEARADRPDDAPGAPKTDGADREGDDMQPSTSST